jgi:AraC-like DNA-binding protein
VLPALLGVPADIVRDRRVALAELSSSIGAIVDRFAEVLATTAQDRASRSGTARAGAPTADPGVRAVRLLADLAARLPGEAPDPGLRVAAAHLGAGASAAETADLLGWTARTLHRRSVAGFGYGPAVLRRVLRFRRARALLAGGLPIADVASRAGYADQPHLSREVRILAGVSPTVMILSDGP